MDNPVARRCRSDRNPSDATAPTLILPGQARGLPMRPPCSTASPPVSTALYSPTALAADRQPPAGTRAFFALLPRQFRGGLLAASCWSPRLARRRHAAGLRRLDVGMLSTTPPAADLRRARRRRWLLMLAVVLLRPVIFVADALVRNHAITPNLVDLVRWQSHWHVIRQSWTYFQNDFAGRIGNKVLQAGESLETVGQPDDRRGLVRRRLRVVAIIVLAGMDPLLLVPIALWLVGYASCSAGRCRGSTASPRRLRSPVGDVGADGRQLHQHPDAEDLRRRRRGGRLRRAVGDAARPGLPAADGDLHLELVAAVPAQRAPRRLGDLDRARGLGRRGG